MYCTQCGQVNGDDARFCQRCGSPFAATTNRLAQPQVIFAPPIGSEQQVYGATQTPPQGTQPSEGTTDTTPRQSETHYVPTGVPPAYASYAPAGYAQPEYPPAYVGEPQTDPKAIASLICGLAFFIAPLTQIAAIVLGHLSRSDIRKSGGRKKGEGMALTGLILGYAQLALVPIVLIIAAVAIPNLLHSRTVANESVALTNVRKIVDAESAAYSQNGSYVCDPQQLDDNRVRSLFDGAIHGGYRYRLNYCTKDGYQVEVPPSVLNSTGRKTFCADQTGTIKQMFGDFASSECLQNGTVVQ